jgi:hypothetical protein
MKFFLSFLYLLIAFVVGKALKLPLAKMTPNFCKILLLSSTILTTDISPTSADEFKEGLATNSIASSSAATLKIKDQASTTKASDKKKDPTFLRCVSNCKYQCLKPSDTINSIDCIQDCQDQCCNSYDQCSSRVKVFK